MIQLKIIALVILIALGGGALSAYIGTTYGYSLINYVLGVIVGGLFVMVGRLSD